MGTSQSSDGPGPGVPMVPPWTPAAPQDPVPPPPPPPGELQDAPPGIPPADGLPPAGPAVPPGLQPPPIAPDKRFGGTRSSLGNFARSGDNRDLRRGLGHYVRSGYGGSNTATRRFGGTAQTAGSLGHALYSTATGAADSPIDTAALTGRSTEEIATAIIEAVRPVDGTQDAEAERAAIHDAMSELLTEYPEADLLHLSDAEREFVIKRFTAIDVARRFELDVGKHLLEKAATATVAMARLKQMRSYIAETVAASFRKLKDQGRTLTAGRIARVVQDALRDTFEVFEGYEE
ncbi:Qat anti-phage system associated protein QatB [Bradyrhizobium sp. SZCCHNS3004]|uniref:Qat anti-phage system associated protein QatB n=1 Tax=Bradyrhizobium sp. SZCCHNS3004 TaxID=3057312 RepID=UPI002916B0EC|nr:Qat anti-phage system associated protein QatB [Bradyrhizobium sp. SZCCHNS3004]